jgi:hypothetical protein
MPKLRGMTRLPLAIRRVRIRVLAVVAFAALGLAGCRSDSNTNGLEELPARTAQQNALAALGSARSAHVSGTSLVGGSRARIDVRFSGRSSRGVVAAAGVKFAFTMVDDRTYIKAGGEALKKLGAPASVRRIAAGRWLRLAPEDVMLTGISRAELVGQLAENESPLDPHVAQQTLDGERVVVVTQQNGSKLYISNTGPAYPLRGDYKGQAAARFEFTEFGADVHIRPPAHPLDAGKLVGRD